jgi:hypothetical protein
MFLSPESAIGLILLTLVFMGFAMVCAYKRGFLAGYEEGKRDGRREAELKFREGE